MSSRAKAKPKSKVASGSGSGSRGSTSMSSTEKKIYHAATHSEDMTISEAQLQETFPDISAQKRSDAINALSRKSLISFVTLGGEISYRASDKTEASLMGGMEESERMVYSLVKDSGNEGIWTKQMKTRANLHQSILIRCLKALESKQMIKVVKSVKNPTRKIYMLYNLEPSTELSGGAWYTDNELDEEFINTMLNVVEGFIKKASESSSNSNGLLPTSSLQNLPNVHQISTYIKNIKISDTQLSPADIQSLLDVLEADRKIVKVVLKQGGSGFGVKENVAGWGQSDDGSGSESESESGSGSESDSENERRKKKKEKEKGRKKRRGSFNSDSDEEEEKKSESESDLESENSSDGKKRKGKKSISKKSKSKSSSSKSTSKSKGKSSNRKSLDIPDFESDISGESDLESLKSDGEIEDESGAGTNSLNSMIRYKGIKPPSLRPSLLQVPCGVCPVENFCNPTGPVNARDCSYFEKWLREEINRENEEEFNEKNHFENSNENGNGIGKNGKKRNKEEIEYEENEEENGNDTKRRKKPNDGSKDW